MSKSAGCWEWTGPRQPDRYGYASIRSKTTGAHRVGWEIVYGAIPKGMVVRHKCDNPICVKVTGNPDEDHLVLGTAKENTRDMVERNRASWQKAA